MSTASSKPVGGRAHREPFPPVGGLDSQGEVVFKWDLEEAVRLTEMEKTRWVL